MPKAKPAPKGPTRRSTFRFEPETLGRIDSIIAYYRAKHGVDIDKTEAIRAAVRHFVASLGD